MICILAWNRKNNNTKNKRSLKFIGAKKNKKLQSKDEFLLVLMRLRLRLHLADRFCISATHCSNIFKTSQLAHDVVATLGFGCILVATLDNVVTTLSQHCVSDVITTTKN